MPKNKLVYPDTLLKKQVRPYNETQFAWDVILNEFFNKEKNNDKNK